MLLATLAPRAPATATLLATLAPATALGASRPAGNRGSSLEVLAAAPLGASTWTTPYCPTTPGGRASTGAARPSLEARDFARLGIPPGDTLTWATPGDLGRGYPLGHRYGESPASMARIWTARGCVHARCARPNNQKNGDPTMCQGNVSGLRGRPGEPDTPSLRGW